MPVTLRNTDILFNDGSTQSTAFNTTGVLNATAGASAGAVGTYGNAFRSSPLSVGTTYAAASLGFSAGTWRCMTQTSVGSMEQTSGPYSISITLYSCQMLRIS